MDETSAAVQSAAPLADAGDLGAVHDDGGSVLSCGRRGGL